MTRNEDIDIVGKILSHLSENQQRYTVVRELLLGLDNVAFQKLYNRQDEFSSLSCELVRELVDYWYFSRLESDFNDAIINLTNRSTFSLLGLICRWLSGGNADLEYVNFARALDSLLKKIWLDLNMSTKDNQVNALSYLSTIEHYLCKHLNIKIIDKQMELTDYVDYFLIHKILKQKTSSHLAFILLFYLLCENLSAINKDESLNVDCYLINQKTDAYYTIGYKIDKGEALYIYDTVHGLKLLGKKELTNMQIQLMSKAEFLQYYISILAKIDQTWRGNIYHYILKMFH